LKLGLSPRPSKALEGPNIAGIDSLTGRITRLFNPRRDKWTRHFRWEGPYPVGKTSVERTTIVVLAMNHANAVAVRQSLTEEGLFSPKV
jgi:hypothetical protein